MIVCICKRVNDSTIRSCVEQGACSLKDVREALNVGLACGACARYARALVRQYVDERREREGSAAA
jgi:bacterioferritin-associated ferredoxin